MQLAACKTLARPIDQTFGVLAIDGGQCNPDVKRWAKPIPHRAGQHQPVPEKIAAAVRMRLLGLALLASCVESQDGITLGRVTLFDQWFRRTEHTRAHTSRHTDGKAGPDAPEAWTVRSKRDVVRGELIYNKAKRVRRGTTVEGNVSVVIKGVGRHDVSHSSNRGGSLLYLELMFMEALRDKPGIPELMGAWFESDGSLTYVVKDVGEPIGGGQGGHNTSLSKAFKKRATETPLALARSLLACFQSWASVGFLLDDFRANQFMMDAQGQIYLVDGPKALTDSVLGVHVVNTYHKTKHQVENGVHECQRDADCPATVPQHFVPRRVAWRPEAGRRGRPGASPGPSARRRRGENASRMFARDISEKTHVWRTSRTGPGCCPSSPRRRRGPRKVSASVDRLREREDPDKRPDFGELLRRVDGFVKARSRRRRLG